MYWFVLSLDPLLVLYHDGYIHVPYRPDDEYEFIITTINDNKRTNYSDPNTWRGSFVSLEQQLQRGASAAGHSENPTNHVRNQMKQILSRVAHKFADHSTTYNANGHHTERPRSYALFAAEFEIDESFRVFLTDLHDDLVASEDHQYTVDLHDAMYGESLRMLEVFNSTTVSKQQRWDDSLVDEFNNTGFEWLLHPSGDDDDGKDVWAFHYDNTQHGEECKLKDSIIESFDEVGGDAVNLEKI